MSASSSSRSQLFSICEIRPYLYIARYRAITDKTIKELGITHAIDATNSVRIKRLTNVEYLIVKIDDDEKSNIQNYFDEASTFIHRAKESGGKTLVYCGAGISRSASLCIMYLVIEENIPLREAFIEVGRARPNIYPNLGFWRQMIDYEIKIRGVTSVNLTGNKQSIPDVYLEGNSLF